MSDESAQTDPARKPPGEEGSNGPPYEVNIEGQVYPWPESTITVVEIRTLGSLPADMPVIEVDLRTNEEVTLPDDAVIELRPGKGFGRKVSFKRG